MATSEQNTLYFNNDHNWLTFNWSVKSLDPANRRATISWNVTLNSDASGAITSYDGGDWLLHKTDFGTVSSEDFEGYTSPYIAANKSKQIAADEFDMSHTGTGEYVKVTFSYDMGVIRQFETKIRLDAPPKGATITSAESINDTENPSMEYTLDYTAVDTLVGKVIFGSLDTVAIVTRDLPKVTSGSYIFQLTDDERANIRAVLKNVSQSSFTYQIEAKFGGSTPLTNSVTRTISIIEGVPTLNPVITNKRADNFILSGDNELLVTPNAVAYKGATIKSIEVWYDGKKTTSTHITNLINSPVTVVAVDSRGYRASKDVSVNLVPYRKLTCNIDSHQSNILDDNTVDITFEISGEFYNGSFNDGGSGNAITLEYRYKEGSGNWGDYEWHSVDIDGNEYSTELTFNKPYQQTMTLEVRVTDTFSEVITTSGTVEVTPIFDWSKDDFNFNVPVTIQDAEVPTIVESGTFTSGSTFYYNKWSNGWAEIWGRRSFTTAVQVQWVDANYGLYTSGTITNSNVKYPTNFFVEKPYVQVSLDVGSVGGILMSPGGAGTAIAGLTQTGVYEIARGTSTGNSSYVINYYIKGRWK